LPKIDRGVLRGIAVIQLALASSLLPVDVASAQAEVSAVERPEGSTSEAGEEAGIRATLGRYLRGSSYNDPELIASAFYENADLFLSHPEKEIFLMTVAEYSAIFANRERGKFNGRTGEILSIDYANDIAIAKAEIGFTERDSRYIDLFLLKKLQGEWKIISKTATQTH